MFHWERRHSYAIGRSYPWFIPSQDTTMEMAGSIRVQFRMRSGRLLSAGLSHPNIASKNKQADWGNGCSQGKDEPHHPGMARAFRRTKGSEQPTAGANEKLPNQKWNVGQRSIGCFLAFG